MGFNQWRPVRPRRYHIDPPKPKVKEPEPVIEVKADTQPVAEEVKESFEPVSPEVESHEPAKIEEPAKQPLDWRWVKPSLRAVFFSLFWFLCVFLFLAYLYLAYISRLNAI